MPLQIPVTQTGLEASIQQAMRNAGRNTQINLGTNSRQINALAQPLGRITGQADEFTKSMEAANARVFAFGASVGIINGVAKTFAALVRNTIEVEKSLVEINTVLGASSDSLQKFGNKLFDVAKTTGQTFDVVAKGALELARQGLSTEETLKRINDALILSRLSGLDAQQSVEGLTAAFNSFKETGITTSEILNKLVVVSQKYSVSERDLIEGLKRSASVADQAGVSFDELVGIITTVQERTARGGAVIGNAFKTIFARIQDTGALQDLSNLGIQVTDLEGKILPATKILQNLGAEFNNLSQLEQADIAKKLGGVYQLSNLLAAVKDLSSEQSKYNDIVKLSAGATNEAYQKNAALNETLAALINKVNVSAQQLGATLGAIGVADSLKGLLSFFNNILEGIQKILGEESALGTFVQGLAKGIGNVLAGPGLALFGAIIAKLSKDLISFGIESLKSFFKIGQSAKEIANVEKAIAAALGSNLTLQRQLFALEGNRAAQLKLMTDAIVQQEAVMRRMSATAGSLAGSLYQQGVRSTGGQGLRVPKAAGGYMPAVAGETSDIRRGVGGARSGDRPVVIPNFAFGGGKKGSMVAHTGEYIVPNFARGGSAIFNRDMIASMGLPSGAQKIGAAGGFIPNFANIATETSRVNLNSIIANRSGKRSPADVAAAKKRLEELENKKLPLNQLTKINPNGSDFGMIVGQKGTSTQVSRFADDQGRITSTQTAGSKFLIDVPVYKIQDKNLKFKESKTINEQLSNISAKTALKMAKDLSGGQLPNPDNVQLIKNLLNPGALAGTAGAIFEAGIAGILKDDDFKDYEAMARNTLIDFKPYGRIKELFNIPSSQASKGLEAKATDADSLISSSAGKFLKNFKGLAAFTTKKASRGFIPNFADPLKEAIDREMSAGVPASQIYVDKNSSLKNAMNPMGLMVANRRDEPAGGMQGINRARKEGANPMLYGAAKGFIPNYAPQRDPVTGRFISGSTASTTTTSSADIEKPKRDLLGVVFAVQTGLSLLTGATSDATSGVGKFTNAVSSVASAASTAMLVGQGLSGLAKEGSAASKILGKVGIAGAIAAGAFEAFKQFASYIDSTNPAINTAKDAMYRVAQAASKAAVNLGTLNPAQKTKVQQERERIISEASIISRSPARQQMVTSPTGVPTYTSLPATVKRASWEGVSDQLKADYENLVDEAKGVGISSSVIFESLNKAALSDGKIFAEEIENISRNLQDLIVNIENVNPEKLIKLLDLKPGEGLGKELGDLNETKLSNLLKISGNDAEFKPIREVLSKNNIKDFERQNDYIRLITDLIKQKGDTEKEEIETAAKASTRQLQETIRNIQIEKNLRNKLFQQTNKANNAQIAADSDIANIKSDITLSELQRNKLIGRRQFQLEKDLALLENQKSEMTEIATLAKQISAESRGVALGDKVAASLQAENAIKALSGQNISETTNVREMLQGLDVSINLITDDTDFQKILTAALKIQDAAAKTTEEFNQQNNFKERGLSLAEAEAKVNENNARVFERMQSAMSAIADDRAADARRLGYKSQMVDAEKGLKLAQFEKSSLGMSSSEKIAGQRAIEREAFDKQLKINTRKSIIEAEADFIRNSKVQDNIQALQDNNTALKENTDALLQVKKVDEPKGIATSAPTTFSQAIQGGIYNKDNLSFIGKQSHVNVRNLDPELASRLDAFGKAFMDRFGYQLQLSSGFRTTAHQARLYKTARPGYAARPGFSQHEFGRAVDFSNGSLLTMAENEGLKLSDYGLTRPLLYSKQSEDWHVETLENRNKRRNGNTTTSIAPMQMPSMVSPEEQMKKARELASLGTAKEIEAAAKKYTSELKLQGDASNTIAENIKNFALRIKEVGEDQATAEMLEKMNRSTQDMSDAIKSIAELEKGGLETQLKDLKESPITFKEGMENGFLSLKVEQAQFAYNLGKEIPKMFSDGISGAIMSAIEGTASLKDALMGAAYEFLKAINQKMIGNLANQFVSGIGNFAMNFGDGGSVPKYASGGMINGGSGSKDDVPAMLMGGEYVVNKKSVQKYGPEFLSAINNGTLGGYAKGGEVQSGAGGFYTPGTYGQGGIQGRQNLLDFATQAYTSGQNDIIQTGENYASINLEGESVRLTNWGRMNNAQSVAIREAKEQAFGLYQQDVEAEKQRKEQQKQLDEQNKAMKKQMLMQIGMAVAGSAAGAGASGFKAAFGAAKAGGATTLSSFGSGLKGVFTGASATGGINVGGLNNWFSGIGKGLTGNFSGAANSFKLSQMGSLDQLGQSYSMGIGLDGKTSSFNKFLDKSGYIPRAFPVEPLEPSVGSNGILNWFKPTLGRATGGIIPQTSGIDTVPAMLSGGEFVMNRAASQNIGTGNLQALNAGAGSLPTEEKTEELNDKLISKLDELIEVMTGNGSSGAITINVDSNGKSTQETSGESSESREKLARQIKDTVMKVIEQEKRLGGKLRRGLV